MQGKQSDDVEAFIAHWSSVPISERAHYQTFIIQLCRLIGAPAPDDERTGDLDYCFERPVRFRHDDGSSQSGYIDCAKRDCFVLEAKQSRKRRRAGRSIRSFTWLCFRAPRPHHGRHRRTRWID